MSLDEYRLPSLRDKIREQAQVERTEEKEVKEEKVEKVKKGRRLNK